MESQVEVIVGTRSFEYRGRTLVEKIRFRGERVGHYTSETELDSSCLKRMETILTLYRCPDGYRVARTLLESRRRRETARWSKKEATTKLLPAADGADRGKSAPEHEYGVYTEEEARRMYPHLFSVVGDPNVRYVN